MSGTPLLGRRYLAPVVVGALLVASVVAALLVRSAEREDAERANEALARQVAAVAERSVELTGASLRGGEGVLRRSGPMPERGFRRYSRDIVTETPFPELQWAPRVAARERHAFERALGRAISVPRPPTKRHPEGDLQPVPRRNGAYLPIRLVHPLEDGRGRLLGLDLLSEPARNAAVRAARDSGRPMITVPSFAFADGERAVILLDPVYQPGTPQRNPEQRRLALRGMLAGPIGAAAIGDEIVEQVGSGLNFAITDTGVDTKLLETGGAGGDGETVLVDVLGRPWEIWVEDVERAAISPPLAVGTVGVLLAALVASLFAFAGRREQLLSQERDFAAAEAETQRETATTLQKALLPPSLPSIPGIDTGAVYLAGAEGLEVGGDFYDLFETGESWTLAIGDVSGKGAEAAALTALVRHTARAFAEAGPAAAVRQVNHAILREQRPEKFATLCVASLSPSAGGAELTIAVAGHPPPLVIRASGIVEMISPTAPLAGAMEEIEAGESELRLEPGETLILYTDGLIEARNEKHGVFGEERLRQVLIETNAVGLDALIEAVLARAAQFSPGFPQDDVAILAIRPTR